MGTRSLLVLSTVSRWWLSCGVWPVTAVLRRRRRWSGADPRDWPWTML